MSSSEAQVREQIIISIIKMIKGSAGVLLFICVHFFILLFFHFSLSASNLRCGVVVVALDVDDAGGVGESQRRAIAHKGVLP